MSNLVTCPVCNGTGKYTTREKVFTVDGWVDGKEIVEDCCNCGGQTQFGVPTGKVPVRPGTDVGCIHSYKSQNVGKCLTRYVCEYCNHTYTIDSGG